MATLRNLKEYLLRQSKQTEFDVTTGNWNDLEIRASDHLHYFYDAASRRLIKSFVLREGPKIDTVCDVVLIKKGDRFTPRLTLWKKDKTSGKPDTLFEESVVSEGGISLIKARVDVGDCHENFWKLVEFLRTCRGIELPQGEFRITDKVDADLLHALEGHDKSAVLKAVKIYLGGRVTEQDVQMLLERRQTLERFDRLLSDQSYFDSVKAKLKAGDEGVWQRFFEENPWIFGYGLTFLACEKFSDVKFEQITTGSNVFTGAGKRSDAVMRTIGFVQTLLFAEIKHHKTDLLAAKAYREPDVYRVSSELSGAVSQVEKTAHKAIRKLEELHRSHTAGGEFRFEVSTVRPRVIVVLGNLKQLYSNDEVNLEKMTSFELYRRAHQDIEILTFDELYERTRYIVETQESVTEGIGGT